MSSSHIVSMTAKWAKVSQLIANISFFLSVPLIFFLGIVHNGEMLCLRELHKHQPVGLLSFPFPQQQEKKKIGWRLHKKLTYRVWVRFVQEKRHDVTATSAMKGSAHFV